MSLSFVVIISSILCFIKFANGHSQPLLEVASKAIANPIDPDETAYADHMAVDHLDPTKEDPILNLNRVFDGGEDLIYGDIVPTSSDSKVRSAIKSVGAKWPGGKVPYVISNDFNPQDRLKIAKAMNEYHKLTCIRFVPQTTEHHYILIMAGSGCYSAVGRTGGKQTLSLGYGCMYTGIVIHELMHAIGFWHEQSRSDRDTYVDIIWNNIQRQNVLNFKKVEDKDADLLGVSYDTCSIMHYGPFAFAINTGMPTIRKKYGTCQLGQRKGFSALDVEKINKLYQCSTTSTTKPSGRGSNCKDGHKDCKYWASIGECPKNPGYMHIHCKKSCSVCDSVTNRQCKDYNENCKRWSELGECVKNKPYMEVYCKGSCTCTGTGKVRNCLDDGEHCSYWAQSGYCYHAKHVDYMQLHCKQSCHFCSV